MCCIIMSLAVSAFAGIASSNDEICAVQLADGILDRWIAAADVVTANDAVP